MYSAKDKMTVYQSTSSNQGSGRVIATTQGSQGLSNLTSDENQDLSNAFGIGASSYYGGLKDFVGPNSSGFLTFAGKLTFSYNADNGRYIHVKLEKTPKRSIAYRYFMCYPQDPSTTVSTPAKALNIPPPPVNAGAGNPYANIPLSIPNFGNTLGLAVPGLNPGGLTTTFPLLPNLGTAGYGLPGGSLGTAGSIAGLVNPANAPGYVGSAAFLPPGSTVGNNPFGGIVTAGLPSYAVG